MQGDGVELEGSMGRRFRISLALAALVVGMVTAGCPKRVGPPTAAAPVRDESPAGRAVALYDDGKCAEARPILESLDAEGQLSGPLLYRLGYCHGIAGDAPKQRSLMERSLAKLQEEAASANNLEVSFFLANALSNLERRDEARAAAAEATGRLESRAWPQPARPLEEFRAAKLYADQARRDEAVRWYRAAIEGFDAENMAAPGYRRWARRYLGEDAFSRSNWTDAERDYSALVALGDASPSEWDRLAVARARLSRYAEAAEAWRSAEKLDPANADRARYSRNLALQASAAGTLPAAAPSGAAWTSVAQADLEKIMADQAAVARSVRAEAGDGSSLEPAKRLEFDERLAAAQRVFLAAALEYSLRNLSIRETAFSAGYAPLIFHADEWKVPIPEPAPDEPEP